ncbi:kinase-like domain-containing protein [Rhizophagus irregularis DAOM 181602=DAOM 197198]|nr:kinase-like domain-containing protein [Rhizophagus irregularis DAOM 181602=DAOM 197198]
MKSLEPRNIVEWIPYSNLKNINYLTKGGFSEIYTADWINGEYEEWDSEKNQLKRDERPGIQNIVAKVVLKTLENVESANQSWFEEAKSHLTINNKWTNVVRCFEEQEAFHINDFNKSNEQNSNKPSKIINTFEDYNEKLPKEFKKLQINSNGKQNINTDDDDEIYNNLNFHSKEQDELEIPDDGF